MAVPDRSKRISSDFTCPLAQTFNFLSLYWRKKKKRKEKKRKKKKKKGKEKKESEKETQKYIVCICQKNLQTIYHAVRT